MPPSGTPVKEAIVADLETTLAAVAAGSDYYNTIEKVTRIDAGPMNIKMFPAVIIVPLSADYSREGDQGTLTISTEYRVQLSLFMRTRTDAVTKIEKLIRDVHKAILVDRTRGGNALNTRALSDEVFYPTEDDEAYTSANLTIGVTFRTKNDDLNIST